MSIPIEFIIKICLSIGGVTAISKLASKLGETKGEYNGEKKGYTNASKEYEEKYRQHEDASRKKEKEYAENAHEKDKIIEDYQKLFEDFIANNCPVNPKASKEEIREWIAVIDQLLVRKSALEKDYINIFSDAPIGVSCSAAVFVENVTAQINERLNTLNSEAKKSVELRKQLENLLGDESEV